MDMPNEKTPVCDSHEPLDYEHFCEMTESRQPWDIEAMRLEVGKCRVCPSHISYPVPA